MTLIFLLERILIEPILKQNREYIGQNTRFFSNVSLFSETFASTRNLIFLLSDALISTYNMWIVGIFELLYLQYHVQLQVTRSDPF